LWKTWLRKYKKRLLLETNNSKNNNSVVAKTRVQVMNKNNPKYVLRNYIAQEVIKEVQNGNYKLARDVLKLLEDPYCLREETSMIEKSDYYAQKPPSWAAELCVT